MIIGEHNIEDKKIITKLIKQYEITNNYKSLGIVIQNDGKLDKQAQLIKNKVNQNMQYIQTLKRLNAKPEYIIMVWYSHVQSHFRYGNIIWN